MKTIQGWLQKPPEELRGLDPPSRMIRRNAPPREISARRCRYPLNRHQAIRKRENDSVHPMKPVNLGLVKSAQRRTSCDKAIS